MLLPHVLAEVTSLSRQIRQPARSRIQEKLSDLIEAAAEISVPSLHGARRNEFEALRLTDAVILHLCTLAQDGIRFALLTADTKLAAQAEMLEYDVLNFAHLR